MTGRYPLSRVACIRASFRAARGARWSAGRTRRRILRPPGPFPGRWRSRRPPPKPQNP